MTKSLLAILAAIALTVGPAVLQGHFSNRWGTPVDLTIAGEQLHQFPRELGPWQNAEDERPLSEAVCRELGLVEHFHRQYVHTSTGERMHVLLMVGPPGRLVRHPPDVCYANRANEQLGDAELIEVSGTERSQFELLRFRRTAQPVPSEFEVAYAFCEGSGTWAAPSSPRMAYGGEPVLYKLQVLREGKSSTVQEDIEDFLTNFVAAFGAVLPSRESATTDAT